jgi:HTH-type transcriptional regulator/antitoxin HipB
VSSNNDITAMQIRTPSDLGLLIRERRRQLGLTQAELAQRTGVGRQWIVEVERGKSRAELGLILRALAQLDLQLAVGQDDASPRLPEPSPLDLDAIIEAARKERK